jgi:hypothetical protein
MKRTPLFILLVLITCNLSAQFLTQSAEGKGTIPLPLDGLGVSADIGKSEIVFGLNNYSKVFSSLKAKTFYGINLAGKNSEGLANLFSAGEIVPEGSLLGFLGRSWNNNKKIDSLYQKNPDLSALKVYFDQMDTIQLKYYPDSIYRAFAKHLEIISDDSIRSAVREELTRRLNLVQSTKWPETIEKYKPIIEKRFPCCDVIDFVDAFADEAKESIKYYTEQYSLLQKNIKIKREEINNAFNKKHHVMRFTAFVMGGIRARSFKRFIGLSTPDFSKSFQDTLYRGGNIGLGLNFQFREIWLGISYGYNNTDNFSELSSKEYTLKTVDTAGSRSMVQEKKVTAYPGKYAGVEINELNIDLMFSIRLDKTDTARLLINPYLRANLFSRDTAYLKNVTNIGVGAFFLGKKRKFMGGLYVELPDVSNNREKAKPAEEQNIRPPFKRLSFGIITRFNISSVFNFSNRARKPD